MRQIRGFTLIELLITLVVAGVILSLAVPSFQTSIARNAVKAASNDLVATLHTARAQSMSTRTPVTVAPASGGWSSGWSLQYGVSVESDHAYVPANKVRIASDIVTMTFRPQGGLTAAADSFLVCHEDPTITGRRITVSFLGRVTSEMVTEECEL